MFRNKFIKAVVSSLLVLLALWVATPKVYIHELLHHNHSTLQIDKETRLQSPSTDDCDFNEYDKPVYFNIFKFINNLVPIKPQNALDKIEKVLKPGRIYQAVLFLRGPPVTE